MTANGRYVRGHPVRIVFFLLNPSDEPAWTLVWYTPFEQPISGDIFRVVSEGREIPYEGRMVKRGDPGPGEYLTLGPHQETSVVVDLAPAYDFTTAAAGVCAVDFRGVLYHAGFGAVPNVTRRDQHRTVTIQGEGVRFVLE